MDYKEILEQQIQHLADWNENAMTWEDCGTIENPTCYIEQIRCNAESIMRIVKTLAILDAAGKQIDTLQSLNDMFKNVSSEMNERGDKVGIQNNDNGRLR